MVILNMKSNSPKRMYKEMYSSEKGEEIIQSYTFLEIVSRRKLSG